MELPRMSTCQPFVASPQASFQIVVFYDSNILKER